MSKEIPSIYFLKVLMTIFIILLHAGCFFGSDRFYLLVWPLFRIAVPVFFMISGYFLCTDSVEKFHDHAYRKIMSMIKFGFISLIVYTLYTIATQGMAYVFSEITSLNNIAVFLLVNHLPYGEHLWYIFAYIYLILAADALFRIRKSVNVTWLGGGNYSFISQLRSNIHILLLC